MGPPIANAFAIRDHTREPRNDEEGRGVRWQGHSTTYPHRRRSIDHELPIRNTIGTSGTGRIRVLHADDENGRWWCGFAAGAANTSSVRNLDIDKIGAADSLTRAVMIMMIIVVK